jgi:hypothetical protein
MQEKKNKRRLIVLIALIVVTIGVLWFGRRERTAGVNKELFKTDLQQIDRIILQTGSDTITLTFNGARWKVNDQWYADRDMIEVLFATLQQAVPVRPVSVSQRDSIYQELSGKGVQVQLYNKETLTFEFLAGGNLAKSQAYFSRPEDQQVYVMTIPGYRVYVSGIFELDESGWREKRVFAFNWQNFQKLEAHYPKNPAQDFSMVMDNLQIVVPGMTATDTARVNDFLDAVSLLTVDKYVSSSASLDSLLSVEPIQILTVNDIGKRDFNLRLFLTKQQEVKGLINGTQWAEFDSRKIRRILVPKDFFAGQ